MFALMWHDYVGILQQAANVPDEVRFEQRSVATNHKRGFDVVANRKQPGVEPL